ncbi:MAG TPA: choice-of-anchor D domain-containing protein [Bryobacteraceae bacterium]|nr:choice-of-anchor D domain-containing protein [Bryobacteraceae bacterium]
MRTLAAALLFSLPLCAQDLSFYIDNSGSLTPLASTYTLASTAAGSSASVTLRVTDTSPNRIEIVAMVVSTANGSTVANSNFSVTGLDAPAILSPAGTTFEDFTVTFAPSAAGQISGFLTVAYAEEQNGCSLDSTDPSTQCPTSLATASQLQGNATSPQLVVTYNNGTAATPGASAPINFGNIAVGSSQAFTFTLTNQSTGTISVPAIALQTEQFAVSPFSLDTSNVPTSLAGSASATFTVTFAPQPTAAGTAVAETATLVVGPNSYGLQGTALPAPGTPVGSDGIQVTCTDETGAHCQATGTTIPMGPDPNTMSLTFTVANPNPAGTAFATLTAQPALSSMSAADFTIQNITLAPYASGVTGASSTFAAGTSITIQPGWAVTFQIAFSPAQAASATATLTIATGITYNLTGKAPAPLNLTLMCGASPCSGQTFTSQQQVQATLQWANTASASVPGAVDLTLSFSSAVSGIKTDPAIAFITPVQGSTLNQISFTQNSPTGTFSNGQSQFAFQTGTTAGTITITATGLENQTQTWSFDILPAKVQITSVNAQQQASNVVVTIDGYDNTYSAGELSFTFYNATGQVISPGAITVNAASNFKQYFFDSNQGGGVFALQATFPVNGDVTQVSSVTAAISNSVGSTSTTQSFP